MNKSELIDMLQKQDAFHSMQASANAKIDLGGKSHSSRANITIVKGQGIRIVFVPLPFVELGRIWFTPEKVVVTDAIHKYYAELSYEEFANETGIQVDYHAVESLFIGRLFTPDSPDGNPLRLFNLSHASGMPELGYRKRDIDYLFTINTDGRLSSVSAKSAEQKPSGVRWTYNKYTTIAPGVFFPLLQTVVANQADKDKIYRLTLDMNDPSQVQNVDTSLVLPKVKSNYEKLSLQTLKELFKKKL